MEITRAKVLGFCMGVKRAVDSAKKALSENSGKRVYTLGPLIHNPTVLGDFEKNGLSVLNVTDIDSLAENSVVIIRAHGTTPSVMEKLEQRGACVIDATCPRVHLSQKRVKDWSVKGYDVVIAGDKNHGEVTSIAAFCETSVQIVQSEQEAKNICLGDKTVLIAQTTFSPKEFEKITSVLREKDESLVVFNSICSATMERQDALVAMAGNVDGILVIGGQSSANTRRLYERASSLCGKVALIENETQIPDDFFHLSRLGITAGASTPEDVIVAVENRLK